MGRREGMNVFVVAGLGSPLARRFRTFRLRVRRLRGAAGVQICLREMKKLFLTLLCAVLTAGAVSAQEYQKHVFGVRAGLNFANVSFDGISPESKAGFHLGGSYQYLFTDRMPLYLETGLQITQKGFKHDSSSWKCNAFYFEIPVLVTYKFEVADDIRLLPAGGFYYGFGFAGKTKMGSKSDTFGSDGLFKRSDFGMRFSASVEWRQYVFGVGYEFSLTNVAKGGDDITTRNIFLSVGYNF